MNDLMTDMPSPLQQALVLASLADGQSRLGKAQIDRPTHLLIENLLALGVAIIMDTDAGTIDIAGTGGYWPNSDAELDCRDSFPLACLLASACSIGRGQYTVVCTAPREGINAFVPLLGSLLDLGAAVSHQVVDGRIAMNLGPSGLRGGSTELAVNTSPCVLAGLLLVAPYASNDVFINSRRPVNQQIEALTIIMERFGAPAIQEGSRFIVPAPQRYFSLEMVV